MKKNDQFLIWQFLSSFPIPLFAGPKRTWDEDTSVRSGWWNSSCDIRWNIEDNLEYTSNFFFWTNTPKKGIGSIETV
jgi:hypothetical protein